MPKIFVPLHQQSKEQPIVPKTGHLWRPGRGLNDGRRRSSMKTRNRGTERGAFRVVVIQRTLKHRTEYEVYEEGNLENGDFISGHFRSWSFSVMVIFNFGYFHCILLFSQLSSINQWSFLSYWLIIRIFYLNLQKICCTRHHIDKEFWNKKEHTMIDTRLKVSLYELT